MDNSKEYILCAAIKRKGKNGDGGIYDVEIGYRHGDIFQRFQPKCKRLIKTLRLLHLYNAAAWLFIKTSPLKIDDEQGFLTSHNRFVNREEAMQIAIECGQVKGSRRYLFSEDLY